MRPHVLGNSKKPLLFIQLGIALWVSDHSMSSVVPRKQRLGDITVEHVNSDEKYVYATSEGFWQVAMCDICVNRDQLIVKFSRYTRKQKICT